MEVVSYNMLDWWFVFTFKIYVFAVPPVDIIRCPLYNQYFQKVLGFRPDFQLIGNTHDLLHPTATTLPPNGNDINATEFSHQTTRLLIDTTDRAINIDCWLKCKQDIECSGYVLFLNVSRCFGLTPRDKTSQLYTPIDSDRLVLDTNAVYFEKICLANGKSKLNII